MAEYQTYPSTAHALGCGMNNGMPVIACICGLPNKGLAPMTTEPKPLDLPPMPEASSYFRPSARAVDWPNYCTDLEAWGRQLAEIAQAQAALADGLAEALENQKRLHCECEDVTDGVCVNCEETDAALAKYRENRR